MNVAALQMDITWENKPANYAKVTALLERAQLARESLVVLPEMFATGFSMRAEAICDTYGGETEQFLAATARHFGIWVLAGAPVKGNDGKPRNKALFFSPAGKLAGFYSKMRPFTPGGETRHYTAGSATTLLQWQSCSVAPFICYDLRFPELFREAARQRPEVYAVLANWPEKRIGHWVRLLQARAIENQAYVVAANRIGADPYYEYPGRSMILDPQGEILADAASGEGCVQVNLDLASLAQYRKGLPFLDDLQ